MNNIQRGNKKLTHAYAKGKGPRPSSATAELAEEVGGSEGLPGSPWTSRRAPALAGEKEAQPRLGECGVCRELRVCKGDEEGHGLLGGCGKEKGKPGV